MGEVIWVRHKNSGTGICLVLDAKKRISYYEVRVFSRGKIFTIVDDGDFYTTALISGAGNEKRITK